MTLAQIAEAVDGTLAAQADGALAVTGPVTVDSRTVEPGGLFAAFAGERADGHDFAAAAMDRGAVAVLASRQVGDPGTHIPAVLVDSVQEALGRLARALLDRLPGTTVVGLTGSSGKTSTKDLLGQVLAAHGATIAPAGSYNNEIGMPLTVLRADEATRYLVLEMGARGVGHIKYLCQIAPPSVGMVLNVGSAHVGEFGSKEQTALAKGELVEALSPDGLAVLNADDPLVAPMRNRTVARVTTFGRPAEADVRATDVEVGADGRARFLLHAGQYADDRRGEPVPVALRVVGEHHVANALAVAAAALGLGLPLESVARELSGAVALSAGRMAVSERSDGVVVVDDAYNANPESVEAALKALVTLVRARPGGRAWAVLGQMLELGERSEEEHDAIGRLAVRLGVDRLVTVGEGAAGIHAGAGREGSWGEESVMVADPDAALALLRAELRPGDVVLVKASNSIGLGRIAEALLAAAPAEGER